MMYFIIILQALGQTVKPVENARYEAYQMRVQGRNYNTNAAENRNHALESMLIPEVLTVILLRDSLSIEERFLISQDMIF